MTELAPDGLATIQAGAGADDPVRGTGSGLGGSAGSVLTLLALLSPLLTLALALAPLDRPFDGHDVNAHLARIAQWHRGVSEGVLYPLYVHDIHWGHGGPVMLFQPPAPYFLAEVFMLAGTGPMRALQGCLAVGLVCGVVGLFLLTRPCLGPTGAALAAAAYALAPYRLLDAWVRAACPELLGTALLPLLLLAARRTAERERGHAWIGLAAASSLLLLTHAPSALFGLPLAGLYGLFWSPPGRRVAATLRLLLTFGLGFGLAAFFLLPATLERVYTNFESSVDPRSYFFYGHHFIQLRQMLDTRWGFGESNPGATDGMSFQVGWVHWIGIVMGVLVVWRSTGVLRRELAFWLVAAAAATYMMTAPSAWLWRALPLLGPMQFPWRFLIVPTLAACVCLGAAVTWVARWPPIVPTLVAAVVTGALAVSYAPFAVTRRPVRDIEARTTPEALQEWTGAHDVWLPRGARPARSPGPRLEAVGGVASIQVREDRTQRFSAQIRATDPVAVRARILDFPGWRATIDGVAVPIRSDPGTGAIVVDVPPGEHELRLRFGSTPSRRLGWAISGLAMLAAAVTGAVQRGRSRHASGVAGR